ncbi:MAG TPA: SDR family NAD(P)-dependent oxidoreductase, partial [Mycobacterium sp.]|nr:SDR family NAD(P)-dependent oxidoreductase [Mycobacterium sp.]
MTEPVVDLDFPLEGKAALVTGGASGIGAAIVSALVTKGARVAVVDLAEDAASAQAAAVGRGARGFRCDVSDPASVTATVDAVIAEFGRIDILVNCAGIVMLAPAEDLTLDAWDKTIDVNLKGTFLVCQA